MEESIHMLRLATHPATIGARITAQLFYIRFADAHACEGAAACLFDRR